MFAIAVILLSLILIVFQDLKYRHIHIILPVALYFAALFTVAKHIGTNSSLWVSTYNSLFFVFTFLVLIAYMSIRNRKITNPFKNYFGLGDLLFFLAVTPMFLMYNYILFFISSMVISILFFFVLKKTMRKETIPLAGYSSLLLLFIIAADLLFDFPSITLIK
jgi:hypothetical protein